MSPFQDDRESSAVFSSDPRNATILKMFSMIDIGERAGSGIPGIVSVWEENFKNKPVYVQSSNPSRVKTVLDITTFVQIDEISSDKPSDKNEFQAINEVSSDKTNQKQEDVEKELLAILEDKQEHSVSELAKVVGLSPSRTRAIAGELVAKGVITALGANRNRTYKILEKK